MTNEQLIAKYNPANSHNLTKAELDAMFNLTDAELKVLAQAYPATLNQKQYLVMYDTKVSDKKQLYNLSTWPKIYNLRKMNNLKNWKPFSFWDLFNRPKLRAVEQGRSTTNPSTVKTARRVIDLSADEAGRELREAIEETREKKATSKFPPPPAKKAQEQKQPVKEPTQKKGTAPAKPGNGKAAQPPAKKAAEKKVELPADQEFSDFEEDDDDNDQ